MKRSLVLLWLLYLIGNGVLLWLGYAWLGMAESNGLHLLMSAAVLLLFACGTIWLHGMALAYFGNPSELSVGDAARTAVRHLPALLLVALIAAFCYWLVALFGGWLMGKAFTVGSWLTMTARKPVSPDGVATTFRGIVAILRWVVLPVLLIPIAARVARAGVRGMAGSLRRPQIVSSLAIVLLLIGAFWIPKVLLSWIPDMPNFAAEMASFLVRGAIAYLLFAALLLGTERIAASGIPLRTQRSNSAIP